MSQGRYVSAEKREARRRASKLEVMVTDRPCRDVRPAAGSGDGRILRKRIPRN